MSDHECGNTLVDLTLPCQQCLRAEIARLRAALREIAECPCHNPVARDCRDIDDPMELWCPSCIARAVLAPGEDKKGEA